MEMETVGSEPRDLLRMVSWPECLTSRWQETRAATQSLSSYSPSRKAGLTGREALEIYPNHALSKA